MPSQSYAIKVNDSFNASANKSSDVLQALFAHLDQGDNSESDVDLYFKSPVVKHRWTSDEDDINWVLNW
jgi:hypothetical protein